jgi:hypothetical protein
MGLVVMRLIGVCSVSTDCKTVSKSMRAGNGVIAFELTSSC